MEKLHFLHYMMGYEHVGIDNVFIAHKKSKRHLALLII